MEGEDQPKALTADERARLEHFKKVLQLQKRVAERMARVGAKVLVASGKGGVGKTTAAVNLALAFTQEGDRVAASGCGVGRAGGPHLRGGWRR